MSAVVSARDLGRWYGQVIGVSDLTVEIGGGITGLLGPNGAGKSTFLRLVTGQLRPSRGTIEVLGLRPFTNRELYRRMGFCPESDALYDDLSGLDFVTYVLRLHGVSRGPARDRAAAALTRLGLADAMERPAATYSKGMRQRTRLAQAIAHGPELLVLDEPLTGLDPVGRLLVMELLRSLRDEGVHVILSSHVLHEVEALAEKILLIHRGRRIADGSLEEIRAHLEGGAGGGLPRRIRLEARDPRPLATRLLARPHVLSARLDPTTGRLEVETRDVHALREDLAEAVDDLAPGLTRLESLDEGLEAIFDYLVG